MNIRGHLVLCIAGALAASMVLAATQPIVPDTEIGRRVMGYLDAFNSGAPGFRAFLEANLDGAARTRRPVDERMAIFGEMRERNGTLTPVRLLQAGVNEMRIVAHGSGGNELEMAFQFAPDPPHGLLGVRVQDLGEGEEGAPAAGRATSEGEALARWGAYVDSLTATDAFSGAVLVARGDSVLARRAYGLASRADHTANRPDTKFNIGSMNKIFTQVAIGQLVKQGKVKLDATIDTYLPDYPAAVASKVTVRHLLEHRGGIGDIFGESYQRADRTKLRKVSDWIPLFRDKPLAFEPGKGRAYSNGGYVLLGAIVERASGEDYYDYVRRHVCAPIGMRDTEYFAQGDGTSNLANGYTSKPGGETPVRSGWTDNTGSRPYRGSPAGGGYSTVDDLFRFATALRRSQVLDQETIASGFGQFALDAHGHPSLGFAGGAPGINGMAELIGPYTIIVLANLDPPAAERVGARLRGLLPERD